MNVPVQCGEVIVKPGDLVCADGDGVLVIPNEHLDAAVSAAEARANNEATAVKAIEAGQSLFELHGLPAAFKASGLKEIDAAWPQE